MRVAWCTDVHLDFVDQRGFEAFAQAIDATKCDALLVGGDISTARDLRGHLGRRANRESRDARLPQRLSLDRRAVDDSVPPFVEACWHEGKISDADWQPYFTCRATGNILKSFAIQHPRIQITVLCGHTHGSGTAQLSPNLRALTAGADYGRPRIERMFAAPDFW